MAADQIEYENYIEDKYPDINNKFSNKNAFFKCGPIKHNYGECEKCDHFENDIREGTFRDDNIEKIIQKDNVKIFELVVSDILINWKPRHLKPLYNIYLSYKNAFFECSPKINKCLLFLLKSGLYIESCGKDKRTILRVAQSYRNIQLFKLLIKKGANINSIDSAGVSILHAAVHMELDIEFINLLLKNGVNLNLHIACYKRDNLKVVQFLIVNGDANLINEKNEYGDTPLHNACYNGNLEIVRFLIENEVDRFIKNNEGNLFLDYLSSKDKPIIEEFIKNKELLDVKCPDE